MDSSLIILASASPRRADLLRQLDTKFQVVPSDAVETYNEQLTARELAQLNAYRKARVVAKRFPDSIVLGADTLVYIDHRFLGKPSSPDEAKQMLRTLQGRTHEVVTGVCLLLLRRHRERIFSEATNVTFRKLSEEDVMNYLNRINPLDKAGGYAIQEQGDMVVEEISGSLTNVIGLPLERLEKELNDLKSLSRD